MPWAKPKPGVAYLAVYWALGQELDGLTRLGGQERVRAETWRPFASGATPVEVAKIVRQGRVWARLPEVRRAFPALLEGVISFREQGLWAQARWTPPTFGASESDAQDFARAARAGIELARARAVKL